MLIMRTLRKYERHFGSRLVQAHEQFCVRETMQKQRKHLNVHIVTSEQRAKRLIARPTLQSFKIINEDVAIVKLMKSSVLLNKPIYIGMYILDLSKLVMYDFHYVCENVRR